MVDIEGDHLYIAAGYAGMIESLDASVGSIRKKLEELKLADHTLLIFASDNGGTGCNRRHNNRFIIFIKTI